MKKIYKLLILLCLVVGCMQAQEAIRIAHGPYLQNLTDEEVSIVWMSNKPSVGWVELAPDDGSHFYAQARPQFYHTTDGVKQTETIHSVRLKGLQPGTRYR